MRIALIVAFLAAQSAVGDDGLWFCADFDSPPELEGMRLDQDMRDGVVVDGRFGRGYRFASGNECAENDFWHIDDPERVKSFPFADGSFVCWFKMDDASAKPGAMFSFCGFWQYQWVFSPFGCRTSAEQGGGCSLAAKPELGTDWHHYATTWNDAELVLYLDGKRVAAKQNPERVDMRTEKRAVLRFGVGGDGRPAFGGAMDEIAVFRRSLSAGEVAKLACGEGPIRNDKVNSAGTSPAKQLGNGTLRSEAQMIERTRERTER